MSDSKRYLRSTMPDAWPNYDRERLTKVCNFLTGAFFATFFVAIFEADNAMSESVIETTQAIMAGEIALAATFTALNGFQHRKDKFIAGFEAQAAEQIEQTEDWQELTWLANVIDPPIED